MYNIRRITTIQIRYRQTECVLEIGVKNDVVAGYNII